MGGSTTVKTTENSTKTAAPPSWTLPGLTTASGDVLAALGQVPASHYNGQQVAYADPTTIGTIQGAYGNTADLANYYTGWMGNQLDTLSTPFDFTTALPSTAYDVGSQYDVNPAIDAALYNVKRQLTQDILPGIKSSALDAGAYSGDRAMMVLPNQAIQDYTDSASRTAATIGYENYRDYENRRLQAYNDTTQNAIAAYGAETQRGLGSETANSQMLGSIGDFVNNILHTSASVGDLLKLSSDLGVSNDQAQINDALARDKYSSYAPFMGLDEASQLLATLSGNWGTQTGHADSTQVTQQDPGMLDFIKAGVGVAGAVAGIPGIGGGGGAASPGPINVTANPFGASSFFKF
jgi:hypothetical protein